jgi:hypothetical protein
MTPTYTRYADHNARNRELRDLTDRIGAPYYQGYLQAKEKRMKIIEGKDIKKYMSHPGRFVSIEMRAWYNPMRWIKGKFYYVVL